MAIFDDITKSEQYQKYLAMLPEEQREEVVASLRKLCEEFEQKILLPIEILKKR
jgi:flagellar motor switch protein FliG